jgi:hypothetical protein
MALAKPLHLRLFLEGQEVPVISANVQVNIFAPASASIQIVPVDAALHLKPRTMVHLFFLEEPAVMVGKDAETGKDVQSRGDLSAMSSRVLDDKYKLLFAGEIVGYSWVKQPMSRGFVLQCMDFSSYWDSLYAFMMDYHTEAPFTGGSAYYGANDALFSSIPSTQMEQRISDWVNSNPQTPGLQGITGLAGGIIRMMEEMSGVRDKNLGINDFFTLAELRCHLLGQICAEENDDAAQNLLSTSVFYKWIFNELQNGGGIVTLRDLMKMMCSFIHYQIVPNPTAKYDAGGDTVNAIVRRAGFASYGKLSNVSKLRTAVSDGVNIKLKQQPLMSETVQAVLTTLTKDVKPSLSSFSAEITADLTKKYTSLEASLQAYLKLGAKQATTPSAKNAMGPMADKARGFASVLNDAVFAASQKKYEVKEERGNVVTPRRLRTQIFRPDTYMVAPPTCNVVFPEMYSSMNYDRLFLGETTRQVVQFNNILDRSQSAITGYRILQPTPGERTKALLKNVRNQYGILMDHEYHTGIIVKQSWMPDGMGISLRNKTVEQAALASASMTWAERVTLHHFFKHRIGGRHMSVSGRFMPYMVAGFPSLVIQKPWHVYFQTSPADGSPAPPAPRSANTVVESRPLSDQEQIDWVMGSASNDLSKIPCQFIGQVESLTHTIGQEGARTAFTMSHCRPHNALDDEYVGKMVASYKAKGETTQRVRYRLDYEKVKNVPALLELYLDCMSMKLDPPEAPKTPWSDTPREPWADLGKPPKVPATATETNQSRMPSVGYSFKPAEPNATPFTKTSTATGTTEKPKTAPQASATVLTTTSFSGGRKIRVPAQPGKRVVGSPGFYGGKISGIEVGSDGKVLALKVQQTRYPERRAVFSSILVYEDVPVTNGLDIPVEVLVRPAWMSTSYDNSQVGEKIYSHFLGCGSVIDTIMTSQASKEAAFIVSSANKEGIDVPANAAASYVLDQVNKLSKAKGLLSIEKAVNAIAFLYGKVKADEKADVDEFVTSFTRRPIASKYEILGSPDVKFDGQGRPLDSKGLLLKTGDPRVGFHMLSVNAEVVSKKNLTGLLEDPNAKYPGANKSEQRAIAQAYDVRWEKLEKVRGYLRELTNKGGGLEG